MKRRPSIAAWIAALAVAGCAAGSVATEGPLRTARNDDIDAIQRLASDWRSGWLAGDAELLLSLYADEPVLMPQDHPAVIGKDAIRPLYRSLLEEFDVASESTLVEVEASGDLGYFWSTYSLTATPKVGGTPIRSKGKSVFIVKRAPGGEWRIARLIDNSDAPSTGGETR